MKISKKIEIYKKIWKLQKNQKNTKNWNFWKKLKKMIFLIKSVKNEKIAKIQNFQKIEIFRKNKNYKKINFKKMCATQKFVCNTKNFMLQKKFYKKIWWHKKMCVSKKCEKMKK